ncbi:MAG: ImmA/IrrE family metallo-endopeptidase [Planctomycetes bacterium]|nr:ImmA/IrrE family metallo-endopeptidase [Planctomycetota bacterium]
MPGEYGDGFDARIEYLPEVRRFVIYYRESGPGRPQGRVHFSIAHELGHFYIPDHRARLLKGEMHNSLSDFRSDDAQEQEADEFAANLLMPKELFINEVRQFRQRVCTLKEICQMADQRFGTSITSTARRYCQCDIEACSIVVSENGLIRWAMHSEDMKRMNMRYVPARQPVPAMSKTAVLWQTIDEASEPVEGLVDAEVWFERPFYKKRLWEEAMVLGNTGLVLTYLTLDADD